METSAAPASILRDAPLRGVPQDDVGVFYAILLGHDVWIFKLSADIKRHGFWSAQHEARADLTMLLGSIYVLMVGGGRWSIDALLANRGSPAPRSAAAQHA